VRDADVAGAPKLFGLLQPFRIFRIAWIIYECEHRPIVWIISFPKPRTKAQIVSMLLIFVAAYRDHHYREAATSSKLTIGTPTKTMRSPSRLQVT
jgi:hypothetical protein